MSSSPTAPPPKEELLRAVRRQNRHAERAREAARAATELRVVELREAAEQCRATMTRLRAERDGGDYALARRRRDECLAEAQALEDSLDPQSELAAVDAAISAAAVRARAREEAEAAEYVAAAKAVHARLHPEPAVYPHPSGWDRESRLAGAAIARRVDPEGDKDLDPSRLVVGWTRFDFVPRVPWRKGRYQELETIGKLDGLLTYHTAKHDLIEQRARESRERLMSRGSSRGAPTGESARLTSRQGTGVAGSSRGGGGITAVGIAGGLTAGGLGFGGSTAGPRPASALTLDAGAGGAGNGGGSAGSPGSRPQTVTRPTSGPGGIVHVSMSLGDGRGRGASRGTSRGASRSASRGAGLDLGGGPGGLGDLGDLGATAHSRSHAEPSALPGVPSATVPRRVLTLRPLPAQLLATLSPTLLRKPAHPAYLLKSEASHDRLWTKTDVKPQLFSKPPVDKAPTLNEERRARRFLQPDRATYNPKEEGKRPWLKTDLRPYPIFSESLLESAWLKLHGTEENKELVTRFYAQLQAQEEGGYEGEDAFGGGSAGAGSGAGAGAGARSVRIAAAPTRGEREREREIGLPASPTDERARLESRERLARDHPLGAAALR